MRESNDCRHITRINLHNNNAVFVSNNRKHANCDNTRSKLWYFDRSCAWNVSATKGSKVYNIIITSVVSPPVDCILQTSNQNTFMCCCDPICYKTVLYTHLKYKTYQKSNTISNLVV